MGTGQSNNECYIHCIFDKHEGYIISPYYYLYSIADAENNDNAFIKNCCWASSQRGRGGIWGGGEGGEKVLEFNKVFSLSDIACWDYVCCVMA